MTAAADHFASFVELLSRTLGQTPEEAQTREATAEELAARLYLSRSHLDRIVASVAGESPHRFRRRILLERAAYRLVTTDRTILDVAVEAGYGSHEAFTRAFSRAYGVGPSRWRTRPTAIAVPAPSDVHFHPPGSLRLPAQKKVTPMDLLIKMVEHHVWLTGEIIERAAQLRDEQLDERLELSLEDDPDPTTLRRLMSRLVGQMAMWNSAVANRAYDWSVEEHESVDSLRRRLSVEGPTYLTQVCAVAEEGRLDDTFVDALCEPAEVFTFGGMIAHVLTFAAHRRTLAVLTLDKHGIGDLGWGDPMLWVAEPG